MYSPENLAKMMTQQLREANMLAMKYNSLYPSSFAFPPSPSSPPSPVSPSSPPGHSSPSPSSPPRWSSRICYPVPSTPSSHSHSHSHAQCPPPASPSVLNSNTIVYLEGILAKEHTLCLQVRSLSTTIAKLTKDVLATGKACPTSFVNILKEQVNKLHQLLATLASIEQHKRTFPVEFVKEVTNNWYQRFTKQKGTKKRKSDEVNTDDIMIRPTSTSTRDAKQRKVFVVIPNATGCKVQNGSSTPKTPMSINSLIN